MKLKTVFCISLILFSFAMASLVSAAPYDIKQMTPAIQQALQNRQGRYSELQALKQSGQVGENNKGYLETLGDGASASGLVQAENADRRVIYQAIVEQNALGETGLAKVEMVFSEVQRDKARSGDFIQTPSGEWVRK